MDYRLVKKEIKELLKLKTLELDNSQKKAVARAGDMLLKHGVILADELGLGKTRVALVIMEAVMRAGGTVAAVVPPQLMYQWEGEVKRLFKDVKGVQLTKNIVHLRTFENLFDKNENAATENFPILKRGNARWVLASQNFGFYTTLTKTPRRYDLFALISLYSNLNKEHYKYKNLKKEIENRNAGRLIKSAALFLKDCKSVNSHSVWNNLQIYSDLKENLFGDKDNLNLAYNCIGELIGNVDFLVIDEAHKSRELIDDKSNDEIPVCKKRLGILLEQIIRENVNSRRFCMTATPIELHSAQWNDLLSRCNLPKVNGKDNYIQRFEDAVKEANANPRNPEILENLIDSSKTFKKNLSEYVIRRKRINQESYRKRLEKLQVKEIAVDSHIEIEKISIDPCRMGVKNEDWKHAIFCFEGMTYATMGLKRVRQKTKQVRYKFAAGFMDFDEYKNSLDSIEESPQKKRMQFYYEAAKKYVGISEDNSDLSDFIYTHPRIVKTAKIIWDFLKNNLTKKINGKGIREKVLVFGTFKKPILALRNTLNCLYIIDCAKKGRPTTRMGLKDDIIWTVYSEYYNGLKREELLKKIDACVRKSDRLREKLKSNFTNYLISKELGLGEISEYDKQEIGDRIRMELLDIWSGASNVLEGSRIKENKELKRLFNKLCNRYKKGISEEQEQSTKEDEEAVTSKKERLFDALGIGIEDNKNSRRRSAFCRLMDGDMKMFTRRVVQELFNDEDMFPRVLIAQSTVGREGLNLQESCRKVFIFNQEWNSAVIAQEIGRIDRIGSLWERMVDNDDVSKPKIEVKFVVFNGTYDECQYNVDKRRKRMLDSELSGIFFEDGEQRVPEEYKEKLRLAAPDFEP